MVPDGPADRGRHVRRPAGGDPVPQPSRGAAGRGAEEFIAEQKRRLGRLSPGERNTLIAFGLAIFLWTLPGLVGLFFGDDSKLYESLTDRWLDEGVVAVIAAGPLFVLPVDWGRRQLILNWNQASRIDWGAIPLVGAGIALGSLMRETGLAKTIGEGLATP